MHPSARSILISCLFAASATASAQSRPLIARADSLFTAGEVARAESLYFIASRRNTSDHAARMALGHYLVSRGAFRIGATLLDEAMQFGGDTAATSKARAPGLQAADDWISLAHLPHTPLTTAERARAQWLAANPPAAKGADSVTVKFEPSSVAGLGRIDVVIGNDTLAADVDPNSDELVLGNYAHYASFVQVFTGEGSKSTAVVKRASIGDMIFERAPARIDERLGADRARIGLTWLAKFAPTADAGAGVLTIRRDGKVSASLARRRVPLVFTFPGILIVNGSRLVPIDSPAGRAVLAEARWTLDLKRGELALEIDAR